jgi:hypothetical protein
MPLVLDEIANDYTDIFSKHLSIGQNSVDSFGNSVQMPGALLVLACEIANSLSRGRIAHLQLGKHLIFLGVMVNFRVDLKIANNRSYYFVIRTVSAVENTKFTFEGIEQPLEIAVLSGQKLNDH